MNILLKRSEAEAVASLAGRAQASKEANPELAGLMSVLNRLLDQNGPLVVYLTAARHGEGTSTIAREVAAAATGWDWCSVALIDASRPAAPAGRAGAAVGLLDAAEGTGDLVFRRAPCGGAMVMQASLTGPDTSLPAIDTVRILFDRVRKQFTLAVVDGPPVLVSQRISAFSAAADCVVLVVEAERTHTADLDSARTRLEQLGARMLGVVLNKRRRWLPGFMRERT